MSADAPGGSRQVLVVLHEEVLGGATLSVLRLVPLLEQRGWRFSFWAADPSELADALRRRGYAVHGAPRPVVYSLVAARLPPGLWRRLAATPAYLREFRAVLRRLGPALVHANSLFTLAEARVARAQRIPVIFHVHEMRPAGWKGTLGRRLAHSTGELVVVSEAAADEFTDRGRRPTIVNECAPYPADAPARAATAETVVGTVGVISPRKGSDLFVEAARIVREREPAVAFRMVGAATDVLEAGWARGVLEDAARAGVAHEPRADVPERLAGWDIFALPSRRDPFPISMLEAMGSGLPVIGTAVDGIAEQVTPDVGILVPPEDPVALAEAVLELHRDPARRLAMGKAARHRAVRRFTLERQAQGLHDVYSRVLG